MLRLKNELKNAINKSNNVIFLHGSNINDVFYNDFNLGTLSLRDSIYFLFKNHYKCELAFYIDIDFNLNCFSKRSYQILEAFFEKKDEPPTEDLNDRRIVGKTKKAQNVLIEKFSNLDKFFAENDHKKLLIIESFEWVSGLFNTQVPNIELIKLLSKWADNYNPNLVVVVLLKETELLSHFYFNLEKENFINIPFAKIEEYFNAFYRYMFLNTELTIPFKKLTNLATTFKTNNFNLKQALNIFTKEVKEVIEKPEYNTENIYEKFNKYFLSPIEEKIDFDNDLILDKQVKERIKTEFKNFIDNTPSAKKGIIFSGPSGTGKTLIAKSLASVEGFNFMPLKLSDLKQLYVGHSSAEVKKLFDKARMLEPTIIFIDEMDSVFSKRVDMNTDSFVKDIVNEFIAQVDGVATGKQRIFVIGATNIPEVLDSAVISRFEMLTIPLPSKNEREKLFELYLPDLQKINWFRINKHSFLEKTEGLSGRDIKEFSNTIKNKLLETDIKNLNKDLFDNALDNFKEKIVSTNRDKFDYLPAKRNFSNFNNIKGYTSIKKEIKTAITSVLKAVELKQYNIEPERGILLEGSPGNGKSFIAQCMAGEFHLDFIKVISSDIASSFYSEDSKKLSAIFDSAFKIARLSKNGCVLFFDEFDGIASKNTNLNLRATMLDLIVKSREIPNLILVAATNYKNLLDEATIRDGRFDKKITINNPTKEDIFDLVRDFLKENDKLTGKSKIDNKITTDMYDKILEFFGTQSGTSRSISGIKVFVNNLKKLAFFQKKFNLEKMLVIDNHIVEEYMASFF